jgi:hypothetical protein
MRNTQAHSTETEAFEKRLRAYAAGAGAAAAGLLALAPPAAAQIVVVPAHVSLGSTPFPIDIEGTTVFTLTNAPWPKTPWGYCAGADFSATAASGGGVVGHGRNNQVGALKFGALIGPADQFEAGKQPLAAGGSCRDGGWGEDGPFANTNNRFLGLKFELNGQMYYGWVGFSGVYDGNATAMLTAYAYETEANTAIYAGQTSDSDAEFQLLPANGGTPSTAKLQPATLGLLALGSLGLDVWRKREDTKTDASEA